LTKEKIKLTTEEIPCRCGKGTFWCGETEDETPCVLHTTPYCKEFEEKDPIDFLKWNNAIHIN